MSPIRMSQRQVRPRSRRSDFGARAHQNGRHSDAQSGDRRQEIRTKTGVIVKRGGGSLV